MPQSEILVMEKYLLRLHKYDGRDVIKVISLFPIEEYAGTLRSIRFVFSSNASSTARATDAVFYVELDASEFQHYYHLVQTENPIVLWYVKKPSSSDLLYFDLQTSREGVGEGLEDQT